jgi:hypothetical protein
MAQQMQTRKARQATPERWQRALQRALFAGVEAKQLAGSGERIVISDGQPGIAYKTNGISWDCEADMLGGNPVFLHRADYWYVVGILEHDTTVRSAEARMGPSSSTCAWLHTGGEQRRGGAHDGYHRDGEGRHRRSSWQSGDELTLRPRSPG